METLTMPLATSLYAALLGLLFVALSLRVIRIRRDQGVALGDDGDARLQRAVRVHANFAEYTPLALVLIALLELGGATIWVVHGFGLALVAGRGLHAWGVSQTPETFRFRVLGMALTFASIGGASLALLAIVLA
jgi:uncharacterized protein